jgi:hypothetical protein
MGPSSGAGLDDGRPGLILLVGLVVTALLSAAVIAVWPDDGPAKAFTTAAVAHSTSGTALTGSGEPSRGETTASTGDATPTRPIVSLFAGGLPGAAADLRAAAGQPSQVIELTVYDSYMFLAYRDPANPANIDRRMWRDGEVDEADKNPIDDRVDADTEPKLFSLDELHLEVLPGLVADAATRYDQPVTITHVIIDRFLPFDQRVLIRVYATPTDGRSGGGYISYDTNGQFVKACC